MQGRKLLTLAGVALVVMGVAVLINTSRTPTGGPTREGLLFPGLESRIGEIRGVRITGGGDDAAVTLARGDDGWFVAEKADYPAQGNSLITLLQNLRDARIIEQKTSNPEFYDRLGVADPGPGQGEGNSGGVRVDLVGTDPEIGLIVGKSAFGDYGTYVRPVGEAGALLVSGEINADPDPLNWIDREILNIPSSDVQSVRIRHADGEPLEITKTGRTATDFELTQLPEGRELQSPYVLNGVASALTSLNLDDVRARLDPALNQIPSARTVFHTFHGLVITVDSFAMEDRKWANFTVGFDAGLAGEFAAGEAETSTAEGTEAATDEAEPEQTAVEERMASGDSGMEAAAGKAERLGRKLAGWTYAIPDFKFEQLRKQLDDLMKAAESEAEDESDPDRVPST